MRTFNKPASQLTPAIALQLLKHGNFRFINNLGIDRDHLEKMQETKDGQSPFAAIVSCMDSRTSAELIFDQGFGDIFSIRIAGNVISPDILGSLEYATAAAGSKLIVVLGHTNCGAIKGACDHVQMGNLTALLHKIRPALQKTEKGAMEQTSKDPDYVNAVAQAHARESAKQILAGSDIICDLVNSGKVGIIPAMYDIATGKVHFYNEDAALKQIAYEIEQEAA